MSFILDALRKSESERQRDAGAVLSRMPVAAARPATPAWAWFTLIALMATVIILGGGWWQTMRSTTTQTTLGVSVADDPATTAPGRSLDDARGGAAATGSAALFPSEPRPGDTAATVTTAASGGPGVTVTAAPAAPAAPPEAALSPPAQMARRAVPTMAEVAGSGLALPPLKLELHVYHENPAGRLVFINGSRYAQGQRLPEGTTVVEIRPVGVVLNHSGTDFLLLQQ